MKLIGSLTSPYVRKVRVVLAEKKIDYDFEVESPWVEGSRVPESNPLGKVPALLLEDNHILFDSRVIVEYLDASSPNNKLIPTPNRERTEVKRWEALADGICDAGALAVVEKRRPNVQQSPEWINRQRDKIMRGLEFMASNLKVDELGEQTWCMGMPFSLADIAAGCALGYITFRFPEIDWATRHPGLQRLHNKLMQRPSFADTLPRE